MDPKHANQVADVTLAFKAAVQFLFSMGSILLASILYRWEKQDVKLVSVVMSAVFFLVTIIFYCAYKCKEPQVRILMTKET
jgi:uncharacterized membrane protein